MRPLSSTIENHNHEFAKDRRRLGADGNGCPTFTHMLCFSDILLPKNYQEQLRTQKQAGTEASEKIAMQQKTRKKRNCRQKSNAFAGGLGGNGHFAHELVHNWEVAPLGTIDPLKPLPRYIN